MTSQGKRYGVRLGDGAPRLDRSDSQPPLAPSVRDAHRYANGLIVGPDGTILHGGTTYQVHDEPKRDAKPCNCAGKHTDSSLTCPNCGEGVYVPPGVYGKGGLEDMTPPNAAGISRQITTDTASTGIDPDVIARVIAATQAAIDQSRAEQRDDAEEVAYLQRSLTRNRNRFPGIE